MKLQSKSIAALLGILPLSLLPLSSFAQNENLVDNGGFEMNSGKPKKIGAIEMATGWVSPTGVRADYFIPAMKVPDIATPSNVFGAEDPKEGKNYAGIVAFSFNDKIPRSYVMTKLRVPLKKGMTYCVSYYVSLAESSKYACNQLGASLTAKPYATEDKSSIIEKPSILRDDNKVLSGMYGWDKVCNTYVAKGGEKYITIGNFSNNADVQNIKVKKPAAFRGQQIIAAYYYIDDVAVSLVENAKDCDCETGDAPEQEVSNLVYQRSVILNDKMTPAQKIEVQAVYFGYGKHLLMPAGKASLDLVAEQMKANPALKVQIIGHSDDTEHEKGQEKEAYANMDSKRTDAVIEYLMEKGIQENRLVAVEKANTETNTTEIIDTDENDLKMAKSRRITFKVIK